MRFLEPKTLLQKGAKKHAKRSARETSFSNLQNSDNYCYTLFYFKTFFTSCFFAAFQRSFIWTGKGNIAMDVIR